MKQVEFAELTADQIKALDETPTNPVITTRESEEAFEKCFKPQYLRDAQLTPIRNAIVKHFDELPKDEHGWMSEKNMERMSTWTALVDNVIFNRGMMY